MITVAKMVSSGKGLFSPWCSDAPQSKSQKADIAPLEFFVRFVQLCPKFCTHSTGCQVLIVDIFLRCCLSSLPPVYMPWRHATNS